MSTSVAPELDDQIAEPVDDAGVLAEARRAVHVTDSPEPLRDAVEVAELALERCKDRERGQSGRFEPKKLVAHGFATATREYAGRRPRTVYTITDAGREALRAWLGEPGGGPLIEFEGLVKVLFAEQAGKDELLATLASIRAEAE